MLGSRKGLRDINKGINDWKSGSRAMKMAFASTQVQLTLLMEERDARMREAGGARSKAYGFGAKRFVEQAERAEHEADKAQKRIDQILSDNPDIVPVRKRSFEEYSAALNMADAETTRRHMEGTISKNEMREELKVNREREKTVAVHRGVPAAPQKSVPERLESLRTLLDQGVVSEAEYAAQRARIIADL